MEMTPFKKPFPVFLGVSHSQERERESLRGGRERGKGGEGVERS